MEERARALEAATSMRRSIAALVALGLVAGCASLTREHTQNIGLMAPGCKGP